MRTQPLCGAFFQRARPRKANTFPKIAGLQTLVLYFSARVCTSLFLHEKQSLRSQFGVSAYICVHNLGFLLISAFTIWRLQFGINNLTLAIRDFCLLLALLLVAHLVAHLIPHPVARLDKTKIYLATKAQILALHSNQDNLHLLLRYNHALLSHPHLD